MRPLLKHIRISGSDALFAVADAAADSTDVDTQWFGCPYQTANENISDQIWPFNQ